jgi:hypothetical protein
MKMPKTYRAYVEMEFEPDENGYLEWESEHGLTPEEMLEEYDSKPRTEEQMDRFFRDELWEYILQNIKYHDVQVDAVKVEQL